MIDTIIQAFFEGIVLGAGLVGFILIIVSFWGVYLACESLYLHMRYLYMKSRSRR